MNQKVKRLSRRTEDRYCSFPINLLKKTDIEDATAFLFKHGDIIYNKKRQRVVIEEMQQSLWLDSRDSRYFITRREKRIIGVIGYHKTEESADVYYLGWLAVDSTFRRRGVGRILVKKVENELKRKGARFLLVDTLDRKGEGSARKFYEACGFKPWGSIPDYWTKNKNLLSFYKNLEEEVE